MPQVTESQAIEALELSRQVSDPETKRRLATVVAGYRDQQKSLGQPMFVEQRRKEAVDFAKRSAKTRAFFQDTEKHGLSDDHRQRLHKIYRDDEEGKAGYFVSHYLSQQYRRPLSQIRPIQSQYRNEMARKLFGGPVASNVEFSAKLKEHLDVDDAVASWGQKMALSNLTPVEGYAKLPEEIRSSERFQGYESLYKEQYERTARNTMARIAPYRAAVSKIVSQLREKTGVTDTGDEVGSFGDLAKTLLDVPPEDRGLVISSIIELSGDGEAKGAEEGDSFLGATGKITAGTAQKLAENFGRGARDLYFGNIDSPTRITLSAFETWAKNLKQKPVGMTLSEYVAQEGGRALASSMSGMASGTSDLFRDIEMEPVTDEMRAETMAEIDRAYDAMDLHSQLRQIADNDIDPAKGENIVTNGVYQATRSLPYTLASMAGPVGFYTTANGLSAHSYDALTRADPTLTRQQKVAISTLGAPIQAGLERVSGKLLTGNLKSLNSFFNQATVVGGGISTRFLSRVAATAGIEMVQENLQDLTPFVIQEALQALDEDMPEANVMEQLGGLQHQKELFFAVLPLAIIGGGGGTYLDVKGGREMLGNLDLMRAAGISEGVATEVRVLQQKGDLDGAQAMFREEFRRSGKDQKPIQQVRQEIHEEALAAQNERLELITKAEEVGILPAMTHTEEGFHLHFKSGDSSIYKSQEAATEAMWQYASDSNLLIHEANRDIVNQVTSQMESGAGIDIVLDRKNGNLLAKVESGEVTREAALKRVEQGERLQDQDFYGESESEQVENADIDYDIDEEYDEAFTSSQLQTMGEDDKLFAAKILGENSTEFAHNVQLTTIKLFEGYTPLTLIEEKLEGDAYRHVYDNAGNVDQDKWDWLVASLRDVGNRLGEDLLPSNVADSDLTFNDIREAYSHLGMSYFTAGADTQAVGSRSGYQEFRDAAQKIMASPLAPAFDSYGRFFQAVWKRGALLSELRKEGKVDEELEEALARSVGFSEQYEFDKSVKQESEAFMGEVQESVGIEAEPDQASTFVPTDDAPFSIIEKGPGFEAFSMPDGRKLEGPASFSIMAFHGTPHKVDKFSLGKIGTGEGAQAYGYGLYFTDTASIAQNYRDTLSRKISGQPIEGEHAEIQPSDFSRTITDGNLYTVELDANQEDFLDWDKPLSEQSEKVKRASGKLTEAYGLQFGSNPSGRALIGVLDLEFQDRGSRNPSERASAELLESGIKGIRYLDGNSRSDGEGSYNYVIFDESLVKILQENGQPIEGENQIKSADPVTRDADGNVIPLSQRFNESRDEISYSILSNPETSIADAFAPVPKAADSKRLITHEVRRRVANAEFEWRPIIDANLSDAEIERERKGKEDELIADKLANLSPSTVAALDAQAGLDDQAMRPILSSLLTEKSYTRADGKVVKYWGGTIMSKSQAKKSGRSLTGYEDIGNHKLPARLVFGGDLSPDQAARQSGYDSVSDFWNALASEIASFENVQEQGKSAQAEIFKLNKEAREESRAWADEKKEQRSKMGGDRRTLIGALRTLDAMLSALPVEEIRGKIGGHTRLAKFRGPRPMVEFLKDRAEKSQKEIEKWLLKEERKRLKKGFKRAGVKKTNKGVPKSNLTADVVDKVARIKELADLSESEYRKRVDSLNSKIEESEEREPTELLNELIELTGFGNLSRMNSDQVKSVADNVELLLERGKLAREIIDAERKAEVDRLVDIVNHDVTGGKGYMLSSESKRRKSKNEILEKIEGVHRRNLSFEWLVNALARENVDVGTMESQTHAEIATMVHLATRSEKMANKASYEGFREFLSELFELKGVPLSKAIDELTVEQESTGVFRIDYGRSGKETKKEIPAKVVKDVLSNKVTTDSLGLNAEEWSRIQLAYAEMESTAKAKGRKIAKNRVVRYSVPNKGRKDQLILSQDQAINLTMLYKQEGLRESMQNEGYSDATMEQMEEFLSPKSKEIRNWLWRFYDQNHSELNRVFSLENGVSLPKIEFYSPAYRKSSGTDKDMTIDSSGGTAMTTTPGFIISRVTNFAAVDQTVGAMQIYTNHSAQSNHYISWAATVKKLRGVFGNSEVKENIVDYRGKDLYKLISERIEWFADGGNRKANYIAFLDSLRNTFTQSSLSFNVPVLIKQLTSLPAYAFDMPLADFAKYSAEFMANVPGNIKEMWATDYVKTRFGEGYERDVMEGLRGDGGYIKTGLQTGMLTGKVGDIIPVMVGGWMAKKRAYDIAIKEGASESEAERRSIIAFEMSTDRAQQAGDLKDISSYQGGDSIARLFTMFKTSPRQYYANVYESLLDAKAGKKGAGKEFGRRFLIGQVILPLVFQLVSDMLRSPFNEPDEEDYEYQNYVRAVLLGPLNGLFIFGDFAEVLTSGISNTRIWNEELPIFESASKVAEGVQDLYQGDFQGGVDELLRGMGKVFKPFTYYDIIRRETGRVGLTD